LALQLELMARLGEILSAESTNADVLVKQQTSSCNGSNMSLIHYHSMPYADLHAQNKSSRCNAHTDSGQLTLLFQDGVGGLEVSSEGVDQCPARFVPVPPRPDTMIVQLGDMLEKQSNGRWRSALHRVTAPPLEATRNQPNIQDTKLDRFLEDRYSIAFFVYPDFDTVIETLPGCEQKGPWNSLDWGNVQTAGDWWRKRIELEFGNMKPASITR
jgi:isopenicillin N synthase-like dioxygenase